MQNIKEYLSYNPLTGEFTRKINRNGRKSGSAAGTKHHSGYINIQYNNKTYQAHRLAWYFTYGCMPNCDIDHINQSKDDNRLENLRLATTSQNMQNISNPQKNNTSGYRGVTWHNNKWQSSIKINRKAKYLGRYNTPEEASEAYLAAKRAHHTFWREIK